MSLFWEGLAYQPVAAWQSGGISRLFAIGRLLRSDNEEVIRTRRALSQSLLYSSIPTPAIPNYGSRTWAVLEGMSEILHRSELCPLDPEVEKKLLEVTGETDWVLNEGAEFKPSGPSIQHSWALLRGWVHSRITDRVSSPIEVFDDESGSYPSDERKFWEYLQDFNGGALRAWVHPQVSFSDIIGGADRTDHRRVDFALCPPWAKTLLWELHGDFDHRDQDKSAFLHNKAREREKARSKNAILIKG